MAESVEEKLDALVARVTRVRRWLVALAVLKIAALSLVFVSVYIGIYAWLDHRWNFDEIGRIIAFILLLGGLVLLLSRLRKYLLVHMSCSGAANYIENIQSFDQQLVTAIEYYENKKNYPYSRVLTEQLVLNVDRDCEEFDFDSTVEKWKGYALSAVILFGLVVALFYIRDNYVYFSSYFTRLIHPLASVEPLSDTSLTLITRNIITEPDSEVTFAAEVKGREPEIGELVLVKLEPQVEDSNQQTQEEIQLRPNVDEEKKIKFETSKSFSQTGEYKYRFEAGSVSTEWNKLIVCEPPDIDDMVANVSLPKRPPRRKWIKPYTEQIEDNSLEVIQGSNVSLDVQTTDKIKEVVVTGLNGKQITKQLNGAQEFSYNFSADTSGSVKFSLVNEQGLANNSIPDLDVRVKVDEPPKFKLVSPEGDYLATDVASVPIIFEVTDDFGLSSVNMYMEVPGKQPEELAFPIEEGTRSKIFTRVIELENYNLNVGDSVLFYAQAADIDTGAAIESRTSRSDVYFIEIRPYRQNWRPGQEGGPSQGAGAPPVELLNILEYTRAILKKTWTIASKSYLTEQDRSRLGFINDDVQYCAEQLALIRDDSEYGFNDAQKAVLNSVLGCYELASRYLAGHNAASAIPPEKNAYRILRKFILEMDLELKPPESGQGQQPEEPDSVKLQEMQEFSEEDKERVRDELKKMQQKLKKLTREQKALKTTFENFLEQQSRDNKNSQSKNGSESKDFDDKQQPRSKGPNKQSGEDRTDQKGKSTSGSSGDKSQSASQNQSTKEATTSSDSSSDKSQGDSRKQNTEEAKTSSDSSDSGDNKDLAKRSGASKSNKSPSDSPGDKQDASVSRSDSKSPDSGKGKTVSDGQMTGGSESTGQEQTDSQIQSGENIGSASAQARLKMLQARQRALQEQVSQLKDDLEKIPKGSEGSPGKGRAEAQEHLEEALAKMDEFQDKLNESRYKSDIDGGKSREAVELMELARRRMDLAKESLDSEVMLSDAEKLAEEAQEIAEQLSDDADAFDESVTPLEREEMLARLEAAKRLLERMPEPQWATIENKSGKGTSSAAQVFTKNPNITSAEAARQIARQFWSIAINAKKYQRHLVEDEPSDVKFFGQENEFFENAAKIDQESLRK